MEMERLGEDEHGVWLGGRAGIPFWRADGDARPFPHTFVLLIGRGWWTTQHFAGHGSIELYADVTTPAEWNADEVSVVDLDLDVIREHDGTVKVLDEDEFEDHRVALRYPDDVVSKARATAGWLREAIGEREEPFGEACARWLQRLPRTSEPSEGLR